jgi:hypothetical protein
MINFGKSHGHSYFCENFLRRYTLLLCGLYLHDYDWKIYLNKFLIFINLARFFRII